jgi:radical SAM superfamily enzyme YgiQ (UPF0313 family)
MILFVYPNQTGHESPHQGIMFLSSYLKQHGYETSLIDFTFYESPERLVSQAVKLDPDLICVTATSNMFKPAVEFCALIKEKLSAPIIFGGTHATVAPDKALEYPQVDMVCISDGEDALLELVKRIKNNESYTDIPNLIVKKNGKLFKNKILPLNPDLDRLPFPDFELFDMERYLEARDFTIDLITGRGCPFRCSYCINYEMQRLHSQWGMKYVRRHSVTYVMDLIRKTLDKYPIKFISFEDDLFTMNKPWLADFCKEFKGDFPEMHFCCNARADMIDQEAFRQLKIAGCSSVQMGIEAGDELIRKNILRRNMTDEQIINAFQAAHSVGLNTTSFNILGSPHETNENMEKTIRLNQVVKPEHTGVTIFCPYPGTRLYRQCVEEGLVDPDFEIPAQHRSEVILKVDPILKKQIKRKKVTFRYRVYRKYNFKKALSFLLVDIFYDWFIQIRARMPARLRKILFRLYSKLSGRT